MNSVNLTDKIKNIFKDIPVVVMNDANAALMGEVKYGAAKGFRNVVMLTIGTGIGCGILIDGKIYDGATGSSGEAGHICINNNHGRLCKCGLTGCLEQYASANGFIKNAIIVYKKYGVLVDDLTCEDIFKDYNKGFKPALEAVNKSCYYLAIGIANIVNILNPDVVVIGGGVSNAGESLLEPLKFYFKQFAFYTLKDTPIRIARYFNDSALYGMCDI